MFDVIAFDADDTLWHNETIFVMTQDKFRALLTPYVEGELTEQKLFETEMRNLRYFGYGIKSFTLSMIETAIELTEGRIPGGEIRAIIEFAKAMTEHPVELLDHVAEVVPQLSERHTLMLITKGDLFDQESKLAKSGLGEHFAQIEIVSDKTPEVYRRIFAKHQIDPQRFLMIGNSLRSDILPVVEAGGRAVYIPYHYTWAHEVVTPPETEHKGYVELEHVGLLLERIEGLVGTHWNA
jgi:putative hydrolase of the HAD superfamily